MEIQRNVILNGFGNPVWEQRWLEMKFWRQCHIVLMIIMILICTFIGHILLQHLLRDMMRFWPQCFLRCYKCWDELFSSSMSCNVVRMLKIAGWYIILHKRRWIWILYDLFTLLTMLLWWWFLYDFMKLSMKLKIYSFKIFSSKLKLLNCVLNFNFIHCEI